jgi:hypothetical protein
MDEKMSKVMSFIEENGGCLETMEWAEGCKCWDFSASFTVVDTDEMLACIRVVGEMYINNDVTLNRVEYIYIEDDGQEYIEHVTRYPDSIDDIEITDAWTFDEYEW